MSLTKPLDVYWTSIPLIQLRGVQLTAKPVQANADATREAGEAREEAIDASDVNAQALSEEERSKVINGN